MVHILSPEKLSTVLSSESLRVIFDTDSSGTKYREVLSLADVELDCPLPRNSTHVFPSSENTCILIPMPGSPNYWRVNIVDLKPQQEGTTVRLTREYIQEKLDQHFRGITVHQPKITSTYSVHKVMKNSLD